jgi:hypothetical protein
MFVGSLERRAFRHLLVVGLSRKPEPVRRAMQALVLPMASAAVRVIHAVLTAP